MDRQRDLQETFEPVVASNKKMTQDIIGDLTRIIEGLQKINITLEAKKETAASNDWEEQAKIC